MSACLRSVVRIRVAIIVVMRGVVNGRMLQEARRVGPLEGVGDLGDVTRSSKEEETQSEVVRLHDGNAGVSSTASA